MTAPAGPPLRLSVLDQSPVSEGSTGAEALQRTLDLARLADGLGYHRYWVAEHHGMATLASTSPEVLIGPIALATARIRVGSGGVMLPHYSALKVAESFSVLAGLLGDRVDLGLGRTAGADPVTTRALQRDRRQETPDDFREQLTELLAYLDDDLPPYHPFGALAALPGRPGRPEPWLLGSSHQSAIWAGELGLPYAFGDFIKPGRGPEIAALYRERFTPSARLAEPRTAVSVWTICADSDEEAQRLAASARMASAMARQGRRLPIPPVERALSYLESPLRASDASGRREVLGSPASVRSDLERVAREYGAEEVIVLTITFDHAARRRSYELIAEAFELTGTAPVAQPA